MAGPGGIPQNLVGAQEQLRTAFLSDRREHHAQFLVRARHRRTLTRHTEQVLDATKVVHAIGITRLAGRYAVRIYTDRPIADHDEILRAAKEIAGLDSIEIARTERARIGAHAQNTPYYLPFTPLQRRPHTTIVGGISIGHPAAETGTLGYFCKRTNDPHTYVLSARHIMAKDELHQPGRHDCFPVLVPSQQIGTVTARVATDHTYPIDAALARLDGIPFRQEILRVGRITGVQEPDFDMHVEKMGRTTGHSTGRITEFRDTLVDVEGIGRLMFQGLIVIRKTGRHRRFARRGDSGALIVCTETKQAVGLYVAGNRDDTDALAQPLQPVLDKLDAQLLT